MRNYYLLIALSFMAAAASAQAPNLNAIVIGPPIGPIAPIFQAGVMDRDFNAFKLTGGASWEEANGFTGNAFFDQDWDKGYIRLENGEAAKDLSLKFNIYTNEIYLKRDTNIIVVDVATFPVAEFGLFGADRSVIFHRGFPAIGTHTVKTFYEILATGNLTLLKLHSKKIVQHTDQNRVSVKELKDIESLYVFDAKANSMSEIRQNRNSLLGSLPAYAAEIRTVMDRDKLRIKNDEDLAALFNALNAKP